MMRKILMENDCRKWKLMTVDPQVRNSWRSGVRSAMPVASLMMTDGTCIPVLLFFFKKVNIEKIR